MFIVENFKTIILNRYLDVQGRARRSEFWYFILAQIIIAIALGIIEAIIGTMFLGALFTLAMLIPTITTSTRRLHDIGRSGWWQLLSFIPLIGIIVLIVFFVTDSDSGSNAYGANPK